jgi:hypothetical protein
VKAYYTEWYPNDGPDLKEVGERSAEQEISVSDVVTVGVSLYELGQRQTSHLAATTSWSLSIRECHGAHRMRRSEFSI